MLAFYHNEMIATDEIDYYLQFLARTFKVR